MVGITTKETIIGVLRARKEMNKSYEELQEIFQISKPTVWNIICGNSPLQLNGAAPKSYEEWQEREKDKEILKMHRGVQEEDFEVEDSETEIDEEEAICEDESDGKDLDYWKTWAEFWKKKYLDEHTKLVELQAIHGEEDE